MDGHSAHHQSHHGVGGNTQRQQGDERSLSACIVGCFRSRHTANVALTERHFTRSELGFLFDGIGRKRRQQSATTGQNTQHRTQSRTTQNGRRHELDVFPVGVKVAHLVSKHLAVFFFNREVGNDLAITKHTHGNDDEANAVGQFRNVKGEAGHTGVHVGTDQTQQQAQNDHGHRLEQRTRGQHHRTNQAQHHERKVLSRAELEGDFSQRSRKGRQNQSTHATGKKGAKTGSR